MKKIALLLLLICLLSVTFVSCGDQNPGTLTEQTFFYGMTTMQQFPQKYLGKDIAYDCFTYRLTDVDGKDHLCGVRKCSASFGCTCGKDTIIGFLLDYDGVIPEPKNQSEDTSDKTWVHVVGRLVGTQKEEITIHSYDAEGNVVPGVFEKVPFLRLKVSSIVTIDGSGLAYYVTK